MTARQPEAQPEMTAEDVCEFLTLMDERGIRVCLDGGWAVDACLDEQTRSHSDLDIVIQERDVPAAVGALRSCGWTPVPREDTTPWCFHLGDNAGREVDFHVIILAEDGRGIYGPPENGEFYSASSLTGQGTVSGRKVACISPEALVAFHTGYALTDNDWADVAALCERFGIPIPDEYVRFR